MRLPRDLSADEIVETLKVPGYRVTRQTGSHLRLRTFQQGEHHLTMPRHHPVRVGTRSAIFADVAGHHEIRRDELLLFGNT